MVDERFSGAQDLSILLGGQTAKIARADVAGAAAEHLRLVAVTVPLDQGFIHRHIPSRAVLHEEGQVGSVIEKLGQHLRFDGPDVRLQSGGKSLDCAQFHAGR
jgi:hypothetical protein